MKMYNQLITALNQCAATCDHCAAACLKEAEIHHLAQCIRTDIACASVCRSTIIMLENGISEQSALRLCEEICRICAEECSKHTHEHCKACATICDECARNCKQAIAA
jgi:DNA-binding XRE family transcriptional regulator